MTKLVLILSQCLGQTTNKCRNTQHYRFHFKGHFQGEKISEINTDFKTPLNLTTGENYLLWLKYHSINDGILLGEIVRIRKLNHIKNNRQVSSEELWKKQLKS